MATVNSADLSAGLNTGDIVECTVEQIMPYGAFVRISGNGRKGMIHISELSYGFVKDINEILKVQDKIKAKIIKIDERGRIDLSLKQTIEPPAPKQPSRPSAYIPRVREVHEVRDFYAMRAAYRENNPEEADSFEKKMASFLKTSEAKITDLNTRNSVRSGRTTRRRNNGRDF